MRSPNIVVGLVHNAIEVAVPLRTPACEIRMSVLLVFLLVATTGTVAPTQAATLKLYWSNIEDNFVRRANLDGTEQEKVVESAGGVTPDIAFDPVDRKMYWPSPVVEGIQRGNYDGSNVETVIHDTEDPWRVAIDSVNRKAYWIDFGFGALSTIWRSNLDGTARELLATTPLATAVEVDPLHGYYYWSDRVNGTIHRTSIADNSQSTIIFDEQEFGHPTLIAGLAIDPINGYIYAADSAFHAILRVGLDGSDPSRWITDGVFFPYAVVVDLVNERVIWSNENLPGVPSQWSNISSVNFEGSDRRIEFSPMFNPHVAGHPRHLALIEIPVPEPCSSYGGAALALLARLARSRRSQWRRNER